MNINRALVSAAVLLAASAGRASGEMSYSSFYQKAVNHFNKVEDKVSDSRIIYLTRTGPDKGYKWVEYRKGKKKRIDYIRPEGYESFLYDGRDYWHYSREGELEKLPSEKVPPQLKMEEWTDVAGSSGTILGNDKVEDRECFRIAVHSPPEIGYFTTSALIVGKEDFTLMESARTGKRGERLVSRYYDHREVAEGWFLAYRIDQKINGKYMSRTVVNDTEVNAGLEDMLFSSVNLSKPADF